MFNLVLFGPPGSGKGTQSEYIIEKYGLVHLSTGDLLREEKKSGSELGNEVAKLIDNGQLVPDSMVQQIVKSFVIKNKDSKGFIFDGFPRTVSQAQWLDSMLSGADMQISLMIALDVPENELVKRLLGRGATSGRADDQDETIIANRIKVYHQQTLPVIDFYKAQNKFAEINGLGSFTEIFERIANKIETM